MDRGSAFSQTCSCGRTFSHDWAFTNHQNSCKTGKKRLSNAIAKAKQALAAKTGKRPAVGPAPGLVPIVEDNQDMPDQIVEVGGN